MAQKPFGRILAETRESHGMDIAYAAQQLRIRADILRAIEQNDFARMPARGYTRNMVGAYARFLGLNSAAITRQYLEEANDYQVSLRQYSPRSTRGGRGQRGGETTSTSRGSEERRPDRNSRGRDVYSDREDHIPRSSSRSVSYQQQPRSMRSSRTRSGRGGYGSISSQPQGNPIIENLPKIAIAVVVVLLVIFIITQIVGCIAPKDTSNVTSVPITGVSDTTGGEAESSSNTSAVVETAPTSVAVSYTVPEGEEVYIEVYENGSTTPSVAEVVTGPSTAAYTVTNKLQIITADSSAIKLTVDGQEVQMTANDDGLYEYTVDFAAVLNQWAQAHKASSASTNTTSNTNSNTAAKTNTTTTNANTATNAN